MSLALAVALLTVACSSGDGKPAHEGLPDCPLDKLDRVDEPVEITFWHAMTRVHETVLTELTNEFNESQDKVRVRLVGDASYSTQRSRFMAAIKSGELPDVAQHMDVLLQRLIDTESVVPVQACMDSADYDTSDYLDPALDYYAVDGVQWALPFNVSAPVLFYNRAAFEKAGIDPDKPPTTLEELRDAAQKIKNAGYKAGLSLRRDNWLMEVFLALRGEQLVNNGNGRNERPTGVRFGNDAGKDILHFFDDMVDDGLTLTTPISSIKFLPGQDEIDQVAIGNLLAVANGEAGMTFHTSAALGEILDVLGSGAYPNVDPGIAPLPGRTDDGQMLSSGGSLYISAQEPMKRAAAWEYMAFLTSPESQATWGARTGYAPVRESATADPKLQEAWANVPGLRVPYEVLTDNAVNSTMPAPLIGDYQGVREVIGNGLTDALYDAQDPDDVLRNMVNDANNVLVDYNALVDH